MANDADSGQHATDRAVGLCGRCTFAQQIPSSRGSVFWLCERAESDPRFRKYPPLPVRHCVGFEDQSVNRA